LLDCVLSNPKTFDSHGKKMQWLAIALTLRTIDCTD
jgi:hypothetical protein